MAEIFKINDAHGNTVEMELIDKLFVDNKEIKNYYGQSLELSPGQHSITVISGVFQAHLSQNFSAGKEYTLEPFTGMNVR